jgi:quinol monooxygenase YgiN
MVTKGLLVRLEIKSGKDDEVETFLQSALPMVRQEAGTMAWFGIRFGRSEYGIFDVFPGEAERDAHLSGAVANALINKSGELLTESPKIQKVEILAHKLPATAPVEANTKGLLLTFKAKPGHEQAVEEFLRKAQRMVEDEPDTTAWFAISLDNGEYGIFDVFPSNAGRFKHLVGQVPRDLAVHALSLLGSVPDMDMLKVIAEKL